MKEGWLTREREIKSVVDLQTCLPSKHYWTNCSCETVGVAQDEDEGDYSSLLVYKYLMDEHADGWLGLMTFSSPSPLPFFFLFFMLRVHTCPSAHACAWASICRSQKRTASISLCHFFLLLPWEDLSLNLEFAVFQLGWLTSKSQQSSSLRSPPSAGVKCAFCHDHPFNVSPEGLIWPCWNPYLFPVPWIYNVALNGPDLCQSSGFSLLNTEIAGCNATPGCGLLLF